MVKTVETAFQVNILKICKVVRTSHSNVVHLEWVVGGALRVGVAVVTEADLVVAVDGHVFRAPISKHEFRKNRFQPHIQCLACAKKCHVLYIEDGTLQCRSCAGLIYECQRGQASHRAYLKAQKISSRLGGTPGQPAPPRPQGMWRKTYIRKIRQLAAAYQAAWTGLSSKNGNR